MFHNKCSKQCVAGTFSNVPMLLHIFEFCKRVAMPLQERVAGAGVQREHQQRGTGPVLQPPGGHRGNHPGELHTRRDLSQKSGHQGKRYVDFFL